MPSLVEEREALKDLIETTYKERRLSFEKSFGEFKRGLSAKNVDDIVSGLMGINHLYGAKLQFNTQHEFDGFMISSSHLKL